MAGNIVQVGGAVADLPCPSERYGSAGEPRGGNHARGNGQSFTERHAVKPGIKSLGKEEKKAGNLR